MSVSTWSTTAATNATIDPAINFREGQAPSTVNNSARALMAEVAKWRDDACGNVLTTGSSTAYAVSTNQTLTPLVDGFTVTVRMHTTNGAASQLNVDATGLKAIRAFTATAVASGSLVGGSIQRFTYDLSDDCWYVNGFISAPEFASGTRMLFQQTAAPTGWTKDVSNNDKALRVVSGSVVGGGSVAFTTAFASQAVSGTVGGTAITIAQMPLHGHPVRYGGGGSDCTSDGGIAMNTNNDSDDSPAHTGSPTNTRGEGIGGTGGGATHTHTFTGTPINLAVAYVDCIVAAKD